MKKKNQDNSSPKLDRHGATGCIAFSDGTFMYGTGFGREGIQIGELCFNTSMTGYQEILTDPSYVGQIVNFTFPHIGNTGTNKEDNESKVKSAFGMITRHVPSKSHNWRADNDLIDWLASKAIVGIGDIDTRLLTRRIRLAGAPNVAICHSKTSNIDLETLSGLARNSEGLLGKELTKEVTCEAPYTWPKKLRAKTYSENIEEFIKKDNFRVVAIDYGAKLEIFQCLERQHLEVIILPSNTTFENIMSYEPDGLFLSNGPGDPMATFKLYGKAICDCLEKTSIPIFGICLGHQLLGLALGAKTLKMSFGHHGANHPVKNKISNTVEITSMNHGFAIDTNSLPKKVFETHYSLFDGSNCGIELSDRKAFSVQYHPEANPGPRDSRYLFKKFSDLIKS
ncbi:MAG: glutamine-hydrolyzing carbamoyl-phosphate synthase small subunit [Pseudomonadota bacterium]|nr:glutamine-hydrolyzing carbamoyl-phosphate synthase small subunit [Pseudomonadota bacterium]